MIELKDLDEGSVGQWVVYTDGTGDKERGKLKSWNDEYIFVVYHANDNWDLDHWKDYTAAATSPEDLEWVQ